MTIDALRQNLARMKEIIREMYIFTNQINAIQNLEMNSTVVINNREKKLLNDAVNSLIVQLRILNKSILELIGGVAFYKKLTVSENTPEIHVIEPRAGLRKELVQIRYKPDAEKEKIAITIGEKDRKEFLENLSKSNLTINQLKSKFSVEKPIATFGKPNFYAKISNHFFRNFSNKLLAKGYLNSLNADLRKMNSPFVVGTYASMILFTIVLAAIFGFFLMIFLLFYKVSFSGISYVEGSIFLRFFEIFWVVFAVPLGVGMLMYFYPKSEGRSLSAKINMELPFVTIHMSSIATSGIEPTTIFEILIKNEEYKHTRLEFRKLLNLINFQGYDLVTALKKVAGASPSSKLRELLDGLATTITSGGDLHEFLDKHAEGLLFDYKLEMERYTKTAETLMDIYISISIAAPMILLMLFIIMGSTGMYFLGLDTNIMAILIILSLVVLNVGFLLFLKLKQPAF